MIEAVGADRHPGPADRPQIVAAETAGLVQPRGHREERRRQPAAQQPRQAVIEIGPIPVVEAEALRTRGEEYVAYQRATSAWIPSLPAGSPRDQTAADSWYTPPTTPTRTATAPLPGARITPSPASRLPLKCPTTPQPAVPLAERGTPRIAAGEVDE